MKKAEIPRTDYLRLFVRKIISGSEMKKKINSIVKLPVTKTISPSESLNICRYQHQVAGIDPAHGKRKHIQLLPDTDSETHSYLF